MLSLRSSWPPSSTRRSVSPVRVYAPLRWSSRRPGYDIPCDHQQRRALRFRQDARITERVHLVDEGGNLVHRRLGLTDGEFVQRTLELHCQRIALTVVQ